MDCKYTQSEDVLVDAFIQGVYERKLQEPLLDRGEELALTKALEVSKQYVLLGTQIHIVLDEDMSVADVHYKQRGQTHNRTHLHSQRHAGDQP